MHRIVAQWRLVKLIGLVRPQRVSYSCLIVIVALVALAAAPGARAQTTWYVDDDAPNDPAPGDPTVSDPLEDGSADHPFDAIQEGIDATTDGDTVLVADGTYTGVGNKNLDYAGKAITACSENGPDNCVIDCENDGRGFYFHSAEGPDSVVEGLTITNGSADEGGAVYCFASSPALTDCTISGNSASNDGGGMLCFVHSNPILTNCTISGNSAGDKGGGAHCHESSPTLANCTISGNQAEDGGGVYCYYLSSPTLIDCTISENSASDDGGGIFCRELSNPTLTNCTISGNSAAGYYDSDGGGVCCSSNAVLINCAISGNSAWYGGGVYGIPTLTNCAISENSATYGGGVCDVPMLTNCTISGNEAEYGGGVCCISSLASPMLTNCTITGNSAADGGAVYCLGHRRPLVANCILWADIPQEISVSSGTPVVTHCDVQGGWTGPGNVNADPLFADPNNGDYRLSAGSPCIDAGCNCAVSEDSADLDGDGVLSEYLPFDLDGEGRFFDDPDTPDTGSGLPPIVDMGAYEFGGSDLPPCHGDLDGDRDVDIADLAELLGHYGMTSGADGADGDMDCDGDIDIGDLAELLGAYGDVCE